MPNKELGFYYPAFIHAMLYLLQLLLLLVMYIMKPKMFFVVVFKM